MEDLAQSVPGPSVGVPPGGRKLFGWLAHLCGQPLQHGFAQQSHGERFRPGTPQTFEPNGNEMDHTLTVPLQSGLEPCDVSFNSLSLSIFSTYVQETSIQSSLPQQPVAARMLRHPSSAQRASRPTRSGCNGLTTGESCEVRICRSSAPEISHPDTPMTYLPTLTLFQPLQCRQICQSHEGVFG